MGRGINFKEAVKIKAMQRFVKIFCTPVISFLLPDRVNYLAFNEKEAVQQSGASSRRDGNWSVFQAVRANHLYHPLAVQVQ